MPPKKIVFISLVQINSLNERGIYQDLMRQFVHNGNEVVIVCPVERRTGLSTRMIIEEGTTILQVRTLNIQKASILEKGVATLFLNVVLKRAIKQHLNQFKFDLILYATPPITITNLISWLKERSKAKTYLLLKDIFPQNAVDMGLFSKSSLLHAYFKKKEIKLYNLSDRIGCMSPANVKYICDNHPELRPKVEENPNSVDLGMLNSNDLDREPIREKWGFPSNAVVYLYGGNLGKPQGATFLLSIIEKAKDSNAFFVIVGDGTDYPVLKKWFDNNHPSNAKLLQRIPKISFDELAACCDVGVILLRKEFTIPNFPSRLLTYLENRMPVLAITDTTSDVGPIAVSAGFGKWSLYGDIESALQNVIFFNSSKETREVMGNLAFSYLKEKYDVAISYQKIIEVV